MSLEKEPLEKFVDAMIAAPLDENGNFKQLSDATYAAHELTSVFGAFLELPTVFMGVPVGALIPPEDLLVLQLMLAAVHAQTCTPERKAEAEAYAAKHMENVVKEMLGIAPEEPQAAPKVELNKQLQDFLASLEGPTTEGQQEEGR